MKLEEYFERSDTPQTDSPIGRLMVKIVEKNPGMDFDVARVEASKLLQRAASKKNYVVPAVLSPEEQIAASRRLKQAFGKKIAA